MSRGFVSGRQNLCYQGIPDGVELTVIERETSPKSFGDDVVLQNLSLTIQTGKTTVIAGNRVVVNPCFSVL